MNKPLYKFYDLENLTQEDLNKLALERNTYKSIIDKIKEIANKTDYDKWELQMTSIEKLMKIQKILEEVE
jgi:cyclopropane fatty-acyl-phospholipid synthase-like methyltransferase